MRVKVDIGKNGKGKRGLIRHIRLAFPNSFLKSRLAVKIIRSGIESNAQKGKTPIISSEYVTRDLLKTFYKCLKQIIEQHGHFNLVEVDASDGTKVIIRI